MKQIFRGQGKDVSHFTDVDRKQYRLAHTTTVVEICGDDSLMDEMYRYCKARKVVGFDTETTGLDFMQDEIILAQIGDSERQYLIWLEFTKPDKLLAVLTDSEIVKVGLNLKFDMNFATVRWAERARMRNVVDTFITAQIIMCGIYDSVGLAMIMASMESQALHWLGLSIPKADELRIGWKGWDPVSFQKKIQDLHIQGYHDNAEALETFRWNKLLYAADDVCIPLHLVNAHSPVIRALGLVETAVLENEFLPVLSDIEVRGMPLDTKAWVDLAQQAQGATAQARRELDKLFDVTVYVEIDTQGRAVYSRDKNYTSPEQLGTLLRSWVYENCGAEVIVTNEHFQDSLKRYGLVNDSHLELLFTPLLVPDPEKPGKKKKLSYPKMKDVVERMWDMYKDYIPGDAFVLQDTNSITLKFLQVIYEADAELLLRDAEHLPTTFGLPSTLVKPILDLREHTKNVTTYGYSWLNMVDSDGRIRTTFTQAALSTGRLSSSPNAQNLPADERYRACIRARPGYKIVGADYSQIEPRVIAQLSKEPTYMRVFWSEKPGTPGFAKWCDSTVTEPLDLYTEVGKKIGQIPLHYSKSDTQGDDAQGIAPKPDGKEGRKQAKVANLGLGYGTGKPKFHYMLCVDTGRYHSREYTDRLFDTYWSNMSTVKAFLDQTSDLASPKSHRKVQNPYAFKPVTFAETLIGRKRFFEEDHPSWWTQGRNMPIQGTAGGDMLKKAALELTRWAWEHNIDGGIINLIHDELLAEVREDQAEEFAKAMQHYMEKVGSELCPDVPIMATAYVSDYWRK